MSTPILARARAEDIVLPICYVVHSESKLSGQYCKLCFWSILLTVLSWIMQRVRQTMKLVDVRVFSLQSD